MPEDTKTKLVDEKKKRDLPGGRDHDDGAGVDQICVKQRPPPAAVKVGAFDHVGVRVDPEHQPTFDVHRQTLWTDQVYMKQGDNKEALRSIKTSCSSYYRKEVLYLCVCVCVLTCVNEYLRLGSVGH